MCSGEFRLEIVCSVESLGIVWRIELVFTYVTRPQRFTRPQRSKDLDKFSSAEEFHKSWHFKKAFIKVKFLDRLTVDENIIPYATKDYFLR